MRIDFVKMHGLGNDFMIFDAGSKPLPTAAQWRRLSDRHTGVGFDQAAVLLPPQRADSDIAYRIFNADGSEAEQSGNGGRCVAALLHARGRARNPDAITMEAAGRLLRARMLDDGRVSVDMGEPNFDPKSLPFDIPKQDTRYRITAAGETLEIGAVSMGNPHAVLCVDNVADAPVERIGPALQASPYFPRQVNVGFMQVMDRDHIRLRVYERGAGETRACGTGACAAAVVGRTLDLLGPAVEVSVPGGLLSVHWPGPGQSVWLTGTAEIAFEGHVDI